MAVTRSWEARANLRPGAEKPPVPPERRSELRWLLVASLLVVGGLAHVFFAKTQDFAQLQARLDRGELVNLNAVREPEDLLPYLQIISDEGQRVEAARRIVAAVESSRPLPNVGALARLRSSGDPKVRLLSLGSFKPLAVVRTPRQYRVAFLQWAAIYLLAFYLVHLAWRWARFRGDPAILPALHVLTGLGLMLAVSLRDPLRDTLEFSKFGWGVAAGCALLLLPLLKPFNTENFAKWIYAPLLASLVLFLLLLRLGTGPTGSDSKVNLGPFQPVELIKILLVFFLAGYFARRWEWLRELREKRFALGPLNFPRLSHALPVMCGVGAALLFFFVLKDLGPALVTGFLFMVMFGIARAKPGLALVGVVLLVGGVAIGYRLGKPHTVVERISMWQSPWDNDVRGGDQLAHSLWAFSTGGALGSGPGWGDPGMIPAGHTDLVLPSIGEEWGFAGVAAVALIFVFLFARCVRAALASGGEYSMFLALGMGALIALEMLLISAGVLGVLPLSGVVSPFLSSGNTAMLCNFLIFAIVLSVSARPGTQPLTEQFAVPVRWTAVALSMAALVLAGKAASVQLLHDRDLMVRESHNIEADGVKRAQRNPRLNSMARELTRGSIYDRNGVLLASSDWRELDARKAQLESLGGSLACSHLESRCYPFGSATLHLLGDLRTGENFHATNASLVEHDQRSQLQGFDDYRELAAVVRYRHQPNNALVQAVRSRDRSVHTSIDIRLQMRAQEILHRQLISAHKTAGALVILNAVSGDLLAMATAPLPASNKATPDDLLDRARYGQYPPGSTFKLVTAMAALRKSADLTHKTFHCRPIGEGRVGTRIPGWNRAIRDDVGDHAHGAPDMMQALTVSCNAYFAQLGVYEVGAKALDETARILEIPDTDFAEMKKMLPFSAYGQGPMLMTPFKMARVSAIIARDGTMPQGRWITGAGNDRNAPPKTILSPESAGFLATAMRSVVVNGTGRRAMAGLNVEVAGKTGTAQMDQGEPHSWFTGFAPYDAPPSARIAFAVVVEHGGYGAQTAAPIARELVAAARDLGILAKTTSQR